MENQCYKKKMIIIIININKNVVYLFIICEKYGKFLSSNMNESPFLLERKAMKMI